MVLLLFLVLCACWSTTWYAIRLCLQGYPPLWGASLRFLLAAALMALLMAAQQKGRPRGRTVHIALLVSGIANGLGYALVYWAERSISGGTAAVISASSPFFTAVAARLYGLEPFVARRLIGVLVGFSGVALMMTDAVVADGAGLGSHKLQAMLLVTVASAILWPLHGAVLKRHANHLPSITGCTYLLTYTALCLLGLCLLSNEHIPSPRAAPLQAHLGLLYLSLIGSVLAWTVYMWLLKRMDLTVLSTMSLIQPVLALVVDWLGSDAQLRPHGYLGAGLVLFGVMLAVLRVDADLLKRLWLRALRSDTTPPKARPRTVPAPAARAAQALPAPAARSPGSPSP